MKKILLIWQEKPYSLKLFSLKVDEDKAKRLMLANDGYINSGDTTDIQEEVLNEINEQLESEEWKKSEIEVSALPALLAQTYDHIIICGFLM